jgi:hypothetical protein
LKTQVDRDSYRCSCGKSWHEPTAKDRFWIVWRHEQSTTVSIRPWDPDVAKFIGKQSYCCLACAIEQVFKLAIEVMEPPREEEFSLTPPKPQRKQTDFNPQDFESDATGYKA